MIEAFGRFPVGEIGSGADEGRVATSRIAGVLGPTGLSCCAPSVFRLAAESTFPRGEGVSFGRSPVGASGSGAGVGGGILVSRERERAI